MPVAKAPTFSSSSAAIAGQSSLGVAGEAAALRHNDPQVRTAVLQNPWLTLETFRALYQPGLPVAERMMLLKARELTEAHVDHVLCDVNEKDLTPLVYLAQRYQFTHKQQRAIAPHRRKSLANEMPAREFTDPVARLLLAQNNVDNLDTGSSVSEVYTAVAAANVLREAEPDLLWDMITATIVKDTSTTGSGTLTPAFHAVEILRHRAITHVTERAPGWERMFIAVGRLRAGPATRELLTNTAIAIYDAERANPDSTGDLGREAVRAALSHPEITDDQIRRIETAIGSAGEERLVRRGLMPLRYLYGTSVTEPLDQVANPAAIQRVLTRHTSNFGEPEPFLVELARNDFLDDLEAHCLYEKLRTTNVHRNMSGFVDDVNVLAKRCQMLVHRHDTDDEPQFHWRAWSKTSPAHSTRRYGVEDATQEIGPGSGWHYYAADAGAYLVYRFARADESVWDIAFGLCDNDFEGTAAELADAALAVL